MFGFSKLDEHATLVARMSDKLGIDFVDALQRGEVSEQESRARVYRCMGCTDTEGCRAFLATDGIASEAPAFCRNKPELDALAAR